MIDHDRLFKELLTHFFVEFVELFLPELAAYLDRDSLVFLDKEVFTDVTAGEKHEADLVARAHFRGQESFFLIHLESQAQSRTPFGRRMFCYFARLHERYHLPVYPIALFSHHAAHTEPDVYEVVFPDCQVLRFQFRVIQLSRLRWQDFVRRPNPAACALMAKMGMAPEERPRVKLECLRLLTTFRLDPARLRLISGFIDTYLRLNAEETLRFEQQAATLLDETEKGKIMELTTTWKEEGRLEGRQEGRREGRQEGEASLVLRQMKRRWGGLAPTIEAQVRTLSVEHLEGLAEALLDFSSPTDLERWLRAH